MNAGRAVYGILSTNTEITDIVDTRIYPEIAEQEAPVPFIVYQIQNVAPEDTHDGPSTLDEVRIEFLCYDATYNGSAELGDKVRGALDRVQGTYNAVNVQSVQFNDVDTEIIDEPRRYAQVLTFTFRIARNDFEIAQGTPVTGAKLGDLYDVDTTGVTDGQVIKYNTATEEWLPATGAGGVETLEELTDVNIIGTPDQGDVISYNTGTSKWMRNGGLQQLLARFKASGTGAQMYDTLSDTTKGYVDVQATSAKIGLAETTIDISQTSPGAMTFGVAAGGSGVETQYNAAFLNGQTTAGTAHLLLKSGTEFRLENAGGYETWLRQNPSAAANITVGLPATGGTLALTTDIPSVPVDSVNGQTGIVVLDTDDIAEGTNKYNVQSDWNASSGLAVILNKPTLTSGTVTSVAMTVPSAFAISGSPITTSGTLALSVGGTAAEYIDGTGALQTLPQGVTSVSGTAPIVVTGSNTPTVSITAATTSAAGSMSAADKTTLNSLASAYEETELVTGQNTLMLTSVSVASNKIVDIMGDALADASNANSKKFIGFHTGIGDCVLQGMVDAVSAISGATAGSPLWIGASGVFSSAAPTTTNYYSRVVGHYIGTGQGGEELVYFNPSQDWVQIS